MRFKICFLCLFISTSIFAAHCPSSEDFSFNKVTGLRLSAEARAEGWHFTYPERGRVMTKIDPSVSITSYLYDFYKEGGYPPGIAVCVYPYGDDVINVSNSRSVGSIPMPPYAYSFPLHYCNTTAGTADACSWEWAN